MEVVQIRLRCYLFNIWLVVPFQTLYTEYMRIKKGMTVQTADGLFVIRHINRAVTPALVMITEKYKKFSESERRIYIRENNLEHSIN